ncbi:hypothetical protein L9F63_016477, partial [Diploptera punctata]
MNNSSDLLKCCYRVFWRHPPDFPGKEDIKTFDKACTPFTDTFVNDDYALVRCFVNDKLVFEDYFAFVQIKPEIEARCDSAAELHNTSDFSVLIMGIDGMSRNHLYRNMPKTVALLQNMSAVDMVGVNTVEFYAEFQNHNSLFVLLDVDLLRNAKEKYVILIKNYFELVAILMPITVFEPWLFISLRS